MKEEKHQRPKIPLKPLTEKEKTISAILWIGTFVTMILSVIMQRIEFSTLFLAVIFAYSFLYIRHNIAQCFKKKYILKSLLYLPLLFIPKFLCEQLLAKANIWWLNFGISLNYLFGFSSVVQESIWITEIIALIVFIAVMFVCNYYEEYYFRNQWKLVGVWALLHLVLGFSRFSIGEFLILCGLGIGFKLIYDKEGIEVSFPTHVFTNLATIFIPIILALIGIGIL